MQQEGLTLHFLSTGSTKYTTADHVVDCNHVLIQSRVV